MYQQINLYQPVFRRQHKVFCAVTLLQILAVAAVLLLGFYGHARWTLHGLDTTAVSLENHYRQLEARLALLEDGDTHATATMQAIERLQKTIDERLSLLDRFSGLAFRKSHGFGEFFEILARQATPGLWLTGISLAEDGETELRGSTVDPELVPRYLQSLPREPRILALHRGSIHLARHEPGKPDTEFLISSNAGEGP